MKQQAAVIAVFVLVMALSLSGCSLIGRLGRSVSSVAPGGLVELPEAGIAVTFPDDWLLESPPSLVSEGLAAVIEPGQRDLIVPLVSTMPPTRHDRCVVADITPLARVRSEWRTLEDVVVGFERLLAADPRWVGTDATIVDLPAGPAGRITRAVDHEAASVTTYIFARPGAWLMLECFAQQARPPDWRSIAATVEFPFLPAEED